MLTNKKFTINVNNINHKIEILKRSPSHISMLINGKEFILEEKCSNFSEEPITEEKANDFSLDLKSKKTVVSPMPGIVSKVFISQNSTINTGDTLFIVEAMKMENNICSQRKGVVEKIHVLPGQEVQTGELLLSFAEE